MVIDNLKFKYKYEDNELFIKDKVGYNVCLFKNGIWAEIIDETIEIKKSVILNTPNDLELVKLIRKMV